jgi:hypothetical protein
VPKTIAGKPYSITPCAGGTYLGKWGDDSMSWQPKPYMNEPLNQQGPAFYAHWAQKARKFPYELSMEEREKFPLNDIMNRCVAYTYYGPYHQGGTVVHGFGPNDYPDVKRPDSGCEVAVILEITPKPGISRWYGSDAACVDWLYNEDYNAGVVIAYVDSTASEVVQDLVRTTRAEADKLFHGLPSTSGWQDGPSASRKGSTVTSSTG